MILLVVVGMFVSAFVTPSDEPVIIQVTPDSAATDSRLRALIEQLRQQSDVCVFLAGGASRMNPPDQQKLLALFDALAILAQRGTRLLVGDGGTQAGIMEAAGKVRLKSGRAFPLVGIAPASEIVAASRSPSEGKKTPVDPNHSHIIAVDDPARDKTRDAWGTETRTMYQVFAQLSEGRPSVTLVANGGEIALNEVDENIRAGRPMIVIAGSGRAADALVSLLNGTTPTDDDVRTLRDKAAGRNLTRRPELFDVLDLASGSADDLARMLSERLARRR